jgi:hypothetical protein
MRAKFKLLRCLPKLVMILQIFPLFYALCALLLCRVGPKSGTLPDFRRKPWLFVARLALPGHAITKLDRCTDAQTIEISHHHCSTHGETLAKTPGCDRQRSIYTTERYHHEPQKALLFGGVRWTCRGDLLILASL